jgi:predicted RNase H-like HicB family nuclease
VRNAREAIAFHLECLEAEGEPIPEESTSPQLVAVDLWQFARLDMRSLSS